MKKITIISLSAVIGTFFGYLCRIQLTEVDGNGVNMHRVNYNVWEAGELIAVGFWVPTSSGFQFHCEASDRPTTLTALNSVLKKQRFVGRGQTRTDTQLRADGMSAAIYASFYLVTKKDGLIRIAQLIKGDYLISSDGGWYVNAQPQAFGQFWTILGLEERGLQEGIQIPPATPPPEQVDR